MRALDLFCCAGGVSMGLHRAGFDVVGIDIEPRPRYPFPFIQADALKPPVRLGDFDFIWASPPCQAYSWSAKRWDVERVDLVEPTRRMLEASGKPYVIENVVGAPIRVDLALTGPMFGLEVIRRRHFECSFFVLAPPPHPPRGGVRTGEYVTVAGHGGDNIKGRGSRAAKQKAMGIDWMDDHELNQAIPPVYSEFIGRAFLAQQSRAADAAIAGSGSEQSERVANAPPHTQGRMQ
jgi:DNA (cytosine-5)-methyltransferase 1